MKFSFKMIAVIAVGMLCCFPAYSADLLKPKHEMRSVWLATVSGIDWPAIRRQTDNEVIDKNVISETGNVAQINKQKERMIMILDSLAKNNMNCVNFQVRSRCDAMYNSAYEPWSSELVAKRGMDPGYDPLQFVIEECHKRGMECHAWLNPYRYETKDGAKWEDKEGEYKHDHPDWLMYFNGQSRLNPGKPEVVQRITDVCKDIITKYDVDGILYDDYFYIDDSDGSSLSVDFDIYEQYLAGGGTLSQNDWRRENVNIMIKSVYDMIQEVKPWVRFGVSPAGVAASDPAVAAKYGVTPCPGSDWQYKKIWSDPLAWVSRQTLDFISPQVYWSIGYAVADYGKITPWWATVAGKFKRNMFVSHDITSLNLNSKIEKDQNKIANSGMSALERSIINMPKASGPNIDTFKEYSDQVKLNRECSLDDAPGSVFYSTKFMYWMAPLFGHYLKNTVFTRQALLPCMTYKPGNNPGKVKNMALNGDKLSWEGYDNVKYTVYAVPESVSQEDFDCDVDYLLGTSFATTYKIPEGYGNGYRFAVCVLDRVGNEYTPVFLGAELKTLPQAKLIAPADGEQTGDPFQFEWSTVDGASKYVLELAYDKEFKDMFRTYLVTGTKMSSEEIEKLKSEVMLYWRVRSMATNCEDGVSEVFTVIPKLLSLLSPEDNSVVSVTPVISWNLESDKDALVEIATDAGFNSIIHTAEISSTSYAVPEFTLKVSTRYYARVTVSNGMMSKTSNAVAFTTEFMDAHIPVVTFPAEGGKFYSEDKITMERQPGVHTFFIELASSDAFNRGKYNASLKNFDYQSVRGGDIKVDSKKMVEGETYYLRVDASYINVEGLTVRTGTCDIVSFVYAGQGSGVEDNTSGTEVKIKGGTEPVLCISAPVSTNVQVKVFSTVGVMEGILYEGEANGLIEIPLTYLSKGMHLIAVSLNGSVRVLKGMR